jgi:hypothetical protein
MNIKNDVQSVYFIINPGYLSVSIKNGNKLTRLVKSLYFDSKKTNKKKICEVRTGLKNVVIPIRKNKLQRLALEIFKTLPYFDSLNRKPINDSIENTTQGSSSFESLFSTYFNVYLTTKEVVEREEYEKKLFLFFSKKIDFDDSFKYLLSLSCESMPSENIEDNLIILKNAINDNVKRFIEKYSVLSDSTCLASLNFMSLYLILRQKAGSSQKRVPRFM